MEWLNYHHLLYFWTVAREGSIARACTILRLAQPTISGQIRALEDSLGDKLFTKSGRGLTLTATGRIVFDYADEIFSLGRELQQSLKGAQPRRFVVGVSDMIPKLIAHRILAPVLAMPEPVQLICEEGSPDALLVDLGEHRLDVVLSETPVTPADRRRVFHHLLGSCGLSVFARHDLAARYRRRFPQSLDEAPLLLPLPQSPARRQIDQWCESLAIRPRIVGEFKDSALIKTFGGAGAGLFFAPSAIEQDVRSAYGVQVVGRLDSLRENFYAISMERRLKHPAVSTLCESARDNLFATHRLNQ
jgi:LysR family transcriptional regulator, transcriptional activator of nhaA